jgi:MoaA/NifB/PqqE/SkfB family radical SAM enzyme
MRLAKKLGVSIVQILEPKAVGHYKGADVLLKREHEELLEQFYLAMNYSRQYRHYPIVTYHGYHQRHTGCFGSGNRNLYIDTDGDIHACPFCQVKRGSALGGDLDAAIKGLMAGGCHDFTGAGM